MLFFLSPFAMQAEGTLIKQAGSGSSHLWRDKSVRVEDRDMITLLLQNERAPGIPLQTPRLT